MRELPRAIGYILPNILSDNTDYIKYLTIIMDLIPSAVLLSKAVKGKIYP